MTKKKTAALILSLALIISLLTGCVKYDYNITIDEDGNGTAILVAVFSEDAKKLLIEKGVASEADFEDKTDVALLSSLGISYDTDYSYEDGGKTYKGTVGVFEFTSLEDARAQMDSLLGATSYNPFNYMRVQNYDGEYRLEISMDNSRYREQYKDADAYVKRMILENLSERNGASLIDAEMNELVAAVKDSFDIRFFINVAGELASSQNANFVLDENGERRTLMWDSLNDVSASWVINEKQATKLGRTLAFTDIAGHWAKNDILKLVDLGVLTGVTESTMEPDKTLTRAEAAAMLRRMFADYAPLPEEPLAMGFDDVSTEKWYYNDVYWAFLSGFVHGKSETSYAPNDTLTNQELLQMLQNALDSLGISIEYTEMTAEDYAALRAELEAAGEEIPEDFDFDEANQNLLGEEPSAWAKEAVDFGLRFGLMHLDDNENAKFYPKSAATRAEFAYMLARFYESFIEYDESEAEADNGSALEYYENYEEYLRNNENNGEAEPEGSREYDLGDFLYNDRASER